ncbi:hypothetical protein Btru_045610 [Bulinus truncatus]|nr:hypothetical protein Btru_045610 [Bulinus truncatus]
MWSPELLMMSKQAAYVKLQDNSTTNDDGTNGQPTNKVRDKTCSKQPLQQSNKTAYSNQRDHYVTLGYLGSCLENLCVVACCCCLVFEG